MHAYAPQVQSGVPGRRTSRDRSITVTTEPARTTFLDSRDLNKRAVPGTKPGEFARAQARPRNFAENFRLSHDARDGRSRIARAAYLYLRNPPLETYTTVSVKHTVRTQPTQFTD